MFFSKKRTLLILKLDGIGDYVLFRNYIEVLKNSSRFRNYEITLCGNVIWKSLAERFDKDSVNKFIWVDLNEIHSFRYRFKLYYKMQRQGFELLLHPTFSRTNFADAVARYCGAKYKIGYDGDYTNQTPEKKKENDLIYDKLIESKSEWRFEFYRYRDFFETLLSVKINKLKPDLSCNNLSEEKYIIICPGGTELYKRWSPANFAALSMLLKEDFPDKSFLVCGSSKDRSGAEDIIRTSTVEFQDCTGKINLSELIDIFSKAFLIITNDSGPFHISVALNKRVACIANGSVYGRFTPYPEELRANSLTIFPEEVVQNYTEEEKINRFHKEFIHTDINTINPREVYIRIKRDLLKY
jgi:ADP-heptose:LPS heptosyltransferase